MPRLKKYDLEARSAAARSVLEAGMTRNCKTMKDLAIKIGCAEKTAQNRRIHPDKLRLGELQELCLFLGWTDEEIIRMVRGY